MKRLFSFKSVETRFAFWFLVVSLSPLVSVGVIVYKQQVRYAKEETFRKLISIRDLKAEQINDWTDVRFGDMEAISVILGKIYLMTKRTQHYSKNKEKRIFENCLLLFRLQYGEKNNFSNGSIIGKYHDETVYSYSKPAGRGHSISQGG